MPIVNFLIYIAITLPLMLLGIFLFTKTTPYDEFRILFNGDEVNDQVKTAASTAVAFDLGGKVIGLALVMGSAIVHAVSLWDLVAWSLIAIVFFILIYWLFELLTPKVSVRKEIPMGNIGVGIFSFCLSIASGLLMAALISY